MTEGSVSTVVDRLRGAGCVFAEAEAELLMAAARSPEELAALVERRGGGGARGEGRAGGGRAAVGAGTRLGGVLRPADRRRPRGVRPPSPHGIPRDGGRRPGPARRRRRRP